MTKFKPPTTSTYTLHGENAVIPNPRRSDWLDVVWQHWHNMHLHRNAQIDWDNLFPNDMNAAESFERAEENAPDAFVCGRPPSEKSASLQFYFYLDAKIQGQMTSFLNYIITYGDSVTDEIVAVVRRCLRARSEPWFHEGEAPVWGSHETFQCGHW
jgi:hypothetical protein